MAVYDSLEYLVKDKEYKAYMQGLNQEPKYTPLPSGYKICDECGISVHSMQYPTCYHCLSKKNPEKYQEINFRASTDARVIEGQSQGGGSGDGAGGTRQDKPNPTPADPRFNEECINDKTTQ